VKAHSKRSRVAGNLAEGQRLPHANPDSILLVVTFAGTEYQHLSILKNIDNDKKYKHKI